MGNRYRIGEVAELAQVSKRTIDYYTNLGLLEAKRSNKNYRYYDESAVDRLKFIEKCKQLNMKLSEIRKVLDNQQNQTVLNHKLAGQVNDVSGHLQQLEHELMHLKPLLDNLTEEQKKLYMKGLSGQVTTLIQTLVLFLS
ncbi:MerR family transcriptional regulator [Bacillus cereus group sp. MYBK249-1]|uniref:MerR family transcriptional regulator n=1 Tax=Bacillus cereus TaxID=1396 RepID=A0AAN6B4P0_BACCE|nr:MULTISPECIES: MerR family transcriptional regulator [Bacillus cereus group]KAB2446199.1 MerR family transcriptional regulator [Bacillus cereus]MCU5132416.1 MerR family transcriptional regulator [Bacillus cereus]MDA2074383.1 MerR family transcriptional regulator [Bacillus cereus]MDA2302701.1 MerR family transcriptional regulator [Bacillus cereus]MDA2308437.1 MerR family transcriptional regulator [Bacillus cereus]